MLTIVKVAWLLLLVVFFNIVLHFRVISLSILRHRDAYFAVEIGLQSHVQRLLLRQPLSAWSCMLVGLWECTLRLHYELLLIAVLFIRESLLEGEIDCELPFLLCKVESEREIHVADINLECLWNVLEQSVSLEISHLHNVMAQELGLWVVLLAHFGGLLQNLSDLLPIFLNCLIDVRCRARLEARHCRATCHVRSTSNLLRQ